MAGWFEFGIAGVTRIEDFLGLTADFNVGGGSYTFQGLRAATGSGEPVEYAQWEAALNGLRWKEPVVAATTGNINISNPGTAVFDGITLTTGDRLLVHNQTTPAQNGVYEFNGSGSALTRAPDADTWDDHINLTVFVSEGSTYADYGYTCTADADGTLGTTAIAFAQFNGGGIPGSHASTHQHGGADEIATATAAANAIPKAGAGGTLASGWIPDLSSVYEAVDATILRQADVDDVPVNGVTAFPISSNWAYDHENAGDPHTAYQLESEKGAANGYAPLDASSDVPVANIPDLTAAKITDFDTEVANNSAVTANTAKVTNATHTGDASGDTALTLQPAAITGKTALASGLVGTDELLISDAGVLKKMGVSVMTPYFQSNLSFEASGAVAAHEAAGDPHTGYQLESEKGAANGYAPLDASSDVPVANIPDLTAAKITDFDTQVQTNRLDEMAAPTAAVNFNKQALNLAAFQTWANDGARPASPVGGLIGFNTARGVPEIYIA